MSQDSDQYESSSIDIVPITELKETEGARINPIDPDHVADLKDSIELEGLIEPIVVTSSSIEEYAYDIVDGRHRKRALEKLGVKDIAVYAMPGDRDYAVPTREAEVDVEIQSMAANVLRKEQTQAEEARFLKNNIENRIIKRFTDKEIGKLGSSNDGNYANARVSRALQLLDHLENVETESAEWKFSDEHYHVLTRILSAADCAPKTASEHIRFYTDSPQDVVDAWKQDDITKGFVKHLRQIDQEDLRTHALERSKASGDDGYSTRDVGTVKKIASYDAPRIHEIVVSGRVSDLHDAVEQAKKEATLEGGPEGKPPEDEPVEVDENGFETFKRESLTTKDRKQAERIADYEDGQSLDEILRKCYKRHKKGDDFRQDLNTAVAEIEELERELAERKEKRRQALADFDFATDSKFADGEADHLAPPIETENFGVFFHDCLQMDDELDNGSVQLVFTSPPYFTQRGRIVEHWWPADGEMTLENADAAYETYLSAMMEVVEECHAKLAEGGHLMWNISDYKVEGVSKVYDIPSDFSYQIRNAEELSFEYISTITWDKDAETSSRLASFRSSNNIADFRPAWRTERILVFRKGGKREKQDYSVDRAEMKAAYGEIDPFTDLWKVDPTTKRDAAHEAGFPIELPELAVKLFTYPGDTVIDPFGGFATTLRAVKKVNEEIPDSPPRRGFAWENFASETADQQDYRKRIEQLLTGRLAQFRGDQLLINHS
jgi:DNA modification methylase